MSIFASIVTMNSNKRKGRTSLQTNNKPGRPRIPLEKTYAVEGVYSNARFMHAAASLVGCLVQVQVKNGMCYEGVFRTFSHQLDFVLEMVQKIDKKNISTMDSNPSVTNLLTSMNSPDSVTEKLIFKLKDIVILSATNLDLDYANKDNFTDSAISKFNGQVIEKELEPWDESCDDQDGMKTLEGEVDEANGWDANDMFRTNAEKYGVTSSYDSTLQGYTVPLEQKNTEEYKRQEAEALKLAQEIENSYAYRNRIMLENGDEEERYSAVIRPENSNNTINNNNNNNSNNNNNLGSTRYGPPMRRKNMQSSKIIRNSPQVATHPATNRSHSSIENQHNSNAPFHSHYKSNSSTNSASIPSTTCTTNSASKSPTIPTNHTPTRNQLDTQQSEILEHKVNGVSEKEEQKSFASEKPQPVVKDISSNSNSSIVANKQIIEKKKEIEKKGTNQKGNREENFEALKKFSSEFKLAEDNKELHERKDHHQKSDVSPNHINKITKPIEKKDHDHEPEIEIEDQENNSGLKSPDSSDLSASNPNNKKYVLNPNAEVFTPRTLPMVTPSGPPPLQPRMQTPSPIVQVPQHQMVPGLTHPVFTTMTPPFVVSATPVSVSLTTPFGPAGSVAQAPRFRKAVPMTLQPRPDMSPPVHVAAATGPPILAPAALSAHPQLTMQYTPPPGVMQAQGPQPTMPYLQMYSVVGPRVMSPQPVAMVPTSPAGSYGETHLPTHMYMPHHPGTTLPMSAMPQGTPGPHSNTSTPQSQTPTMHAPSPVHQPPVSHGTPAHTPTPTGHLGTAPTPQPVLYHGPMTSQHSLQHVGNPTHMASISHHHSNFPTAPQPVVLMHQQPVPNHHPSSIPSSGPHALQGHPLHGQTPGNHILQPGAIPTSATMVPVPPNTQFVPHHQGV